MLCRCETYGFFAKEEKRTIEAFETRRYIRKDTQKISWTDRIINKEVLDRVSEGRSLWKNTRKR